MSSVTHYIRILFGISGVVLAVIACSGGSVLISSDKSSGSKTTTNSHTSTVSPTLGESETQPAYDDLAIEPTNVSGSFLICGDASNEPDGNYGCAVHEKVTEHRMDCDAFLSADITYDNGESIKLTPKSSGLGSYWHFVWTKDPVRQISAVSSRSRCSGQYYQSSAEKLLFVPRERVILFVSTGTSHGNMGETAGADQICSADIPGAKALFSDTGGAAHAKLPVDLLIVNSAGGELARNAQLLWVNGPQQKILYPDRSEADSKSAAWTGSAEDGGLLPHSPGGGINGSGQCDSWRSMSTDSYGYTGSPNGTKTEWFTSKNPTPCNLEAHVYCFIQK